MKQFFVVLLFFVLPLNLHYLFEMLLSGNNNLYREGGGREYIRSYETITSFTQDNFNLNIFPVIECYMCSVFFSFVFSKNFYQTLNARKTSYTIHCELIFKDICFVHIFQAYEQQVSFKTRRKTTQGETLRWKVFCIHNVCVCVCFIFCAMEIFL